ncbi:hypothetical protein [Mucilaginibacter jinjuensis]|uniref:Uncharacterized protein n=1 Tax=Mucilaginibacter jinjuensis TaxID=1176721 RepID=A0ABY7TBH8_9SPHI|nr:hypothetical protein [Mucilaginibacter jinjuensis]WCT13668.1 hypothetical protein PQO05_06930 [Mucilaginibacter jinjuensis]
MKKLFLIILSILAASYSYAQTWQPLNGNLFLNTGNVGIGVTNPEYKLDVYKGTTGSALNITGVAVGSGNDTGMDFSAANGVIATYVRIGLQISNGGTGNETGGLILYR